MEVVHHFAARTHLLQVQRTSAGVTRCPPLGGGGGVIHREPTCDRSEATTHPALTPPSVQRSEEVQPKRINTTTHNERASWAEAPRWANVILRPRAPARALQQRGPGRICTASLLVETVCFDSCYNQVNKGLWCAARSPLLSEVKGSAANWKLREPRWRGSERANGAARARQRGKTVAHCLLRAAAPGDCGGDYGWHLSRNPP